MSPNDIPSEPDPTDAVNMKSKSSAGAPAPITGNALLLWQYEFEQSLMEEQIEYQQQAVAVEASIKEAALRTAAGADEIGKLLKQETDTSMVDLVKELSSRRLTEGVELQSPLVTSELLRSNLVPGALIRLEKEGNRKEMRSGRSKERGSKHRSRSRERRGHRSRSRSMERGGHKSRSRERGRHRSRSRSRARRSHRSKERLRNRSRSRSGSRKRRSHRSRSRERCRHWSKERRSHRGRSRSKTRAGESCRSGKIERRRINYESRSRPKGSNRDESSFPESRNFRSSSSPHRGKQNLRIESEQRHSKSQSHAQISNPKDTNPIQKGKTVERTMAIEGVEITPQLSLC